MINQELPEDKDSEAGIISTILTSPEKLVEIIDLIKPNDFSGLYNQQIWTAIIDLFQDGQQIDLMSIRSKLKTNEKNPSPAVEILMEHFNNAVFGINLDHFIKAVRNKSLLRQIIRVTQVQGYSASMDDAIASQIITDLEKNILEIVDSAIQTRPVDASGIIDEVDKDIIKVKEKGWIGYNTGFSKLDERTGGLIPTHSWIIGGYTGSGKTFMILQIIINILRQGGRVVLFSTEMDRKWNILRLLGNIAGLSPLNIARGNLLENEMEEFKKAKEELISYKDKLIIFDSLYTLADIKLKAKKIKLTKGLDVMVVDFIQNLRGGESIYERMSEAAIGLQQMAQELEVCMILGSQVNQASAGWQSKEAIEFKGAGEIAAIADVALWMSKTDDEHIRKIVLRKIRHGAPGFFEVKLKFPSGRVEGLDDFPNKDISKDSEAGQLI